MLGAMSFIANDFPLKATLSFIIVSVEKLSELREDCSRDEDCSVEAIDGCIGEMGASISAINTIIRTIVLLDHHIVNFGLPALVALALIVVDRVLSADFIHNCLICATNGCIRGCRGLVDLQANNLFVDFLIILKHGNE